MTAKTDRPAPKRFTPELLAEAAKLRADGMTWGQIGAQLDVRSTGLLSKRVRDAGEKPAGDSAKPARRSTRRSPTPTPTPRPRKTVAAAKQSSKES